MREPTGTGRAAILDGIIARLSAEKNALLSENAQLRAALAADARAVRLRAGLEKACQLLSRQLLDPDEELVLDALRATLEEATK